MRPEHPPFEKAEKCLRAAVYILAIGEGDVRSRLKDMTDAFITLDEDDLPEKHRSIYRSINERLIKFPGIPELGGAIAESIRRMKRATGQKLAIQLVDMYFEVRAINDDSAG